MGAILSTVRLTTPYWTDVLRGTLADILTTCAALLIPYGTKLLVDEVFPNHDWNLLYFIIAAVFVVSAFNLIIDTAREVFEYSLGLNLGLEARYRFYQQLHQQDMAFYDQRSTGELLSRFEDLEEATTGTLALLGGIVTNTVSLLLFPAILFFLNWKLALISLIALPLDVVILAFSATLLGRTERAITVQGAALAATNFETLSGIRTILSMGLERVCFNRYWSAVVEIRHLEFRQFIYERAGSALSAFVRTAATGVYTWYGWTAILSGEMQLGSFLAFTMYVGHLYSPVSGFLGIVQSVQTLRVHAERFLEVLERTPAVQDRPGAREVTLGGIIQFKNVSFCYRKGEPVLEKIDLSIERGQLLGIVGRSGSGKSTLVELIPRFYDVTAGHVEVDGIDVRDLRLRSHRRQIGFAQQVPFLFTGTILENIAVGRDDISARRVEEAVRLAGASEFIQELQGGLESQVGERGVALSEGQKQRIVLARVLLLDTPVTILDEATSALDLVTEAEVLDGIREARRGKTTVIITHRLTAMESVDRVVVLDRGRIVEEGSHSDLMRMNGLYARMYNSRQSHRGDADA